MTNFPLFVAGFLVTLIVAGAVCLLIWGAILDGREDDERRGGQGRAGAARPAVANSGAAPRSGRAVHRSEGEARVVTAEAVRRGDDERW